MRLYLWKIVTSFAENFALFALFTLFALFALFAHPLHAQLGLEWLKQTPRLSFQAVSWARGACLPHQHR